MRGRVFRGRQGHETGHQRKGLLTRASGGTLSEPSAGTRSSQGFRVRKPPENPGTRAAWEQQTRGNEADDRLSANRLLLLGC